MDQRPGTLHGMLNWGSLKHFWSLSEFRVGVVSEANAVLGSGAAFVSFEFANAINFQFTESKKIYSIGAKLQL